MEKIVNIVSQNKRSAVVLCCITNGVLLLSNFWVGMAMALVGVAAISLLVFNKLYKKTNHFNNQSALATDFVSNEGYRLDLARNYEIVNVGSNPARFAFFYEQVRGRNWSTGTQGLDMDLEILKTFHSYLAHGAWVILPIVPFSSVSGYLNNKPKSAKYLAKYARLLDSLQLKNSKNFQDSRWRLYSTFPLLTDPRLIRYVIRDVAKESRLEISENPMCLIDMEQDARRWIEKCWKPEFNIRSLHDEFTPELNEGFQKSVKMMSEIIDFLQEREYKPIIISTPISSALGTYFTPDVKNRYVTDFAKQFEPRGVPFLDYMHDEVFSKHEYYFNALFMNLRGRKEFTKKVMRDLENLKGSSAV